MEKAIQEKSFQFAIRIVNLCKYLQKNAFDSIMTDCDEIKKLLISIVKSAKE